jgi:hypothetical protein
MANIKTLQRSFGGGEVTPEMFGRTDDQRYHSGAALLRNFITLPHGPAANRPGFAYVRAVKTSAKRTRLIPFTYSTTQTMVIEVGDLYLRFHTQGATLESSPGVPYEIATPYVEADLFDLHFVQSADVMTLVHPGYAPRELKRLGALSWTLTTISFVSALTAPSAPTVTPTGAGSTVYNYKVTSVGTTGLEESAPSALGTGTGNVLVTGQYMTITWTTTGATLYNVYKQSNGLYGYIGQTDGLTFKDDNIAADLGKTPPTGVNPFGAVGTYPGAVSYFEQRRCFAGSTSEPQNLRMTRSGTESNLSYSIPTRDDDAINIRVAAREANTIRHIVPLSNMVLLTGAAEWRVTSVNSDAITPTSVSVKPQSYIGANNVQPLIVNNNILYAAARGGHLREMAYNYQAGGYITGDLSLRTPHLFDGLDIVDMAYAKAPQPLVWSVSSNGKLLGMTYVPEQQVGAIHQHDTDGLFESCCVVAEGTEDALYVVVQRTINGASKRYIERMAPRLFATAADAFFVDCGATYSGAATTVINGLDYLEGKTVSVLGDGAVFPQKVVTSGAITLEQACTKVQVGLPITADLQTLPLAMETKTDGASMQGRYKNVNKVWLRVYRSSGIFVGPDDAHLTEAKQRSTESYGSAPALKSEEIPITLTPSWSDSGQVFIRQVDPLPLTIVSMTVEVAIGG